MIATNILHATIKLFNAIPYDDEIEVIDHTDKTYEIFNTITIPEGFVLGREVYNSLNSNALQKVIDAIKDIYGRDAKKLNATFHKSWEKVRNSSIEQLYLEQIAHYITTYGFEALGIYDEDFVYIPKEKLEVPMIDSEKILIKVFRGITSKEIKEKVLSLLNSGIALKDDTLKDIITLAIFTGFNSFDLGFVKNKEAKARLYKELNLVPNNAEELLRYVIYRITGKSLVIKDRETIEAIKVAGTYPEDFEAETVYNIFNTFYMESGSYVEFARIFNRHKKLFLALKKHYNMSPIINKISKLSKVYHEPMQEDLLNDITGKIKGQKNIALYKFKEELEKANIFRKIRLAQALGFRVHEDSKDTYKVYKIRNGKSFVKPFSNTEQKRSRTYFEVVIRSIMRDISSKVKGKTILLSENLRYGLPSSEKQFTGNLPSGSYVDLKDSDMVIGVNWFNLPSQRVDLDFSAVNANAKVGWDAGYRGNGLLFSGDVTDAKGKYGATEAFYVDKSFEGTFAFYLNWFNYSDKSASICPFKLFVASENDRIKFNESRRDYVIDPNNIVTFSNSEIEKVQRLVGFIHGEKGNLRFYFSESNTGSSISARSGQAGKVIQDMKINFEFYSLNELLAAAGAEIVYKKEDDMEIDFDLSYENVSKETIIELLTKETE